MPSAVVLLSGGLDSYTAAAILQRDGFDVCALSVIYGQRHACAWTWQPLAARP